jgi:hypothetical protein
VRALAALDGSPFVVRYYNVWIEPNWEKLAAVGQLQGSQARRQQQAQGRAPPGVAVPAGRAKVAPAAAATAAPAPTGGAWTGGSKGLAAADLQAMAAAAVARGEAGARASPRTGGAEGGTAVLHTADGPARSSKSCTITELIDAVCPMQGNNAHGRRQQEREQERLQQLPLPSSAARLHRLPSEQEEAGMQLPGEAMGGVISARALAALPPRTLAAALSSLQRAVMGQSAAEGGKGGAALCTIEEASSLSGDGQVGARGVVWCGWRGGRGVWDVGAWCWFVCGVGGQGQGLAHSACSGHTLACSPPCLTHSGAVPVQGTL